MSLPSSLFRFPPGLCLPPLLRLALLDAASSRRRRVAFWASNALPRSSRVIDCLLLSPLPSGPPFSSHPILTRPRPLSNGRFLKISFGSSQPTDHPPLDLPHAASLLLSSPWLKEQDLEIYDIRTRWNAPAPLGSLSGTLPVAFDLNLIVLDAVRENHLLLAPHHHLLRSRIALGPAVVLLDSPYSDLELRFPHFSCPIIHVNSAAALRALEALGDQLRYTDALHQQLLQSGICQVRDLISAPVTPVPPPGSSSCTPKPHQLNLALVLAQSAISHSVDGLVRENQELSLAESRLHQHEKRMNDLAQEAHRILTPRPADQVLFKIMQRFLHTELAWWKLWAVYHRVGQSLQTVTETVVLAETEKELTFQAGQLKALAKTIECALAEFINDSLLKPFISPTLANAVSQATLHAKEVHLHTLSTPLYHRWAQLSSPGGPIDVLHSKAQDLTDLTRTAAGGLVVLGLSTRLATFVKSDWTLFAQGMPDLPIVWTCLAVLLVWIAQGKWQRAKKNFLEDWSRWRHAMITDLTNQAPDLIQTKLCKPCHVGLSGVRSELDILRKKLDQKKGDVDVLKEEWGRVEKEWGGRGEHPFLLGGGTSARGTEGGMTQQMQPQVNKKMTVESCD